MVVPGGIANGWLDCVGSSEDPGRPYFRTPGNRLCTRHALPGPNLGGAGRGRRGRRGMRPLSVGAKLSVVLVGFQAGFSFLPYFRPSAHKTQCLAYAVGGPATTVCTAHDAGREDRRSDWIRPSTHSCVKGGSNLARI